MAKVSIGIPVRNGARYLAETIDSVLSQTYTDFELIISDNASSDQTSEICKNYAENDSRVRYYRNDRNIGAAKNFNRAFALSSGEYFKWLSSDDTITARFLERSVELLDSDRALVLACTRYSVCDEFMNTVVTRESDYSLIDSRPQQRFCRLLKKANRDGGSDLGL